MYFRRFILILFCFTLFQIDQVLATSYEVEIVATVPGCGDAVIQSGEQCDGTNLGGSSCSLLGFTNGTLSCSSVCTFVTAECVLIQSSGADSTRPTESVVDTQYIPATNLVISGYAESYMQVQVLLDGVLVATAIADRSGKYQTTVSGLSAGLYRLQLFGISPLTKQRSQTETIEVRIVADATTKLSNVTIPLTYAIDEVVDQVVVAPTPCGFRVDLNKDCAVNIIDFQLARWMYIFSPASLYFDFDDSQKLDLVDFSILAYHWTG